MTYLTLRDEFELGGQMRTNNLKVKMVDDNAQIFVNNGHTRDGGKKRAHFRLSQAMMKEMMEFLQNNLK